MSERTANSSFSLMRPMAMPATGRCSGTPASISDDDERLRLAAREERRTVRPGQDADLGDDRAHRLGVAPVDAAAFLEDRAAHDLLLEVLEELAGELALLVRLE